MARFYKVKLKIFFA